MMKFHSHPGMEHVPVAHPLESDAPDMHRAASGDIGNQNHERTPVRFFLSYAHEDRHLKNELLRRLTPYLKTAKDYDIDVWEDGDIVLGENWDIAIKHAISKCDFGLLLVSINFRAYAVASGLISLL